MVESSEFKSMNIDSKDCLESYMVTTHIPGQIDLIKESVTRMPGKRVLDIGFGNALATKEFLKAGFDVVATGYDIDEYFSEGNKKPEEVQIFENVDICNMRCIDDEQFDAVWCAHVLEHTLDTGKALSEIRRVLKPNGRLFISVPPFKPNVVGGHVTPGWNIGILMYVLAIAGFGLKNASFVRHGYNIFADVERGAGPLPNGILKSANGDLDVLRDRGLFPHNYDVRQGFNGDISNIHWEWNIEPIFTGSSAFRKPHQSILKIAFFVPWITKGKGGTENVGQMMANTMVKKGHHVAIFTFENDEEATTQWPLDDRIKLVKLSEDDGPLADSQMALQVAEGNYNLIVGLHMNRTFGRYVRCARLLDLPLVVSEHIDPLFPERLGTFGLEERLVFFSGATRIHLLVEAFRKTLPRPILDRVRVIPNTVPLARKQANPEQENDRKTLLTVARLVPRKNLNRLIRIFAGFAEEVADWDLRIVGDGPQLNELKKLCSQLHIAERVHFEGHSEDTYPFYEKAHLFVLPSLYEGFPMTGLEAMAHGLPMVGYKVCNGINVQIRHGVNGLLSSGGEDAGSLEKDLITLMKDASIRKRMGKASADIFAKEYAENIIANKWEELFFEAVNQYKPCDRLNLEQYLAVKLNNHIFGEESAMSALFEDSH